MDNPAWLFSYCFESPYLSSSKVTETTAIAWRTRRGLKIQGLSGFVYPEVTPLFSVTRCDMLLTIRTTHNPATDLGFLLHKNPSRVQSYPQSFGQAHVFYPEASEDGCTVALLLDVDPVGLVRRRRGPSGEGGTLDQYVNDRPYVASSFLSVAISDVFGTAMTGRSKERPDLAESELPFVAKLAVVPCKGGEPFLRRLFEPLGYGVAVTHHPLDERSSDSVDSRYFTMEISGA